MPLIETIGSGSARAFGLNSGESELLVVYPSGVSWAYEPSGINSSATTWTALTNNYTITIEGTSASKIKSSVGNGSTKSNTCLQLTAAGNSRFVIPASSCTSSGGWTFLNLARYSSSSSNMGTPNGRIFDSPNQNMLCGWWEGRSGVGYLEGELSPIANDRYGKNWVLNAMKHNFYRANGTTHATSGAGSYNSTAWIGQGGNAQYGQSSDSQIIAMAWWNRDLSLAEIQSVENQWKLKYGLTTF
jgi:hypothetical protein